MPTTANFSLEYPDDNSSVDIAGHFETLADDVDEAINTRLALTGGTLTGALVGTLTTDSSSSTTGAFKTAGGMGIAKALYVGTTLNVAGAATFSNTVQSTGFLASAAAATSAGYQIYTGSSLRWNIRKENTAESGSDAGSDLVINRYNDSGVNQGVNFRIDRSTGLTTLYGDLTISKAGAVITASSTTGNTDVIINGVAGNAMSLRLRTAGNNRWTIQKDTATESGSNVGADFKIWRYTDAGAVIDAPLTITRSTGAITLTGTLNGKVVNDLITGPASATDNALVRFDGTTGKVVQNSGITVDDSGYITSDVTMSKASPILSVSASTTTTASIYFDNAAAGSYGRFLFRVNGSKRWEFGRDGTAEAGANAGSDFYISNYSDASAAIGIPFKIARSTGKTTLGYVGATAGLELGSLGPRVMSGTGSPQGVVTAPVGSMWTDTAATTGAIRWIKATGSGSSGWVVEYGDTGVRNIAASISNSWTVWPHLHLRRVGSMVTLYVRQLDGAAASATTFVTLPTGFRPAYDFLQFPVALTGSAFGGYGAVYSTGEVGVFGTSSACTGGRLEVTFATSNAWPSSLPGSAA